MTAPSFSLPGHRASFDLPDVPTDAPKGALRDAIEIGVVGPVRRVRKPRRKHGVNKCAACGMEGHNKRSPKCAARRKT